MDEKAFRLCLLQYETWLIISIIIYLIYVDRGYGSCEDFIIIVDSVICRNIEPNTVGFNHLCTKCTTKIIEDEIDELLIQSCNYKHLQNIHYIPNCI